MSSYLIKSSQEDWGVTWDTLPSLSRYDFSDQASLDYIHDSPAAIITQYQTLVSYIFSFNKFESPSSLSTLFHPRQIKQKREIWWFYEPSVTWHFLSPIQVCKPTLILRHQLLLPSCSPFGPCTPRRSLSLLIFKVGVSHLVLLLCFPLSHPFFILTPVDLCPFVLFFKQVSWGMTYIPWNSLVLSVQFNGFF